MKRLLTIACLLTCFIQLQSQTPESLVHDVQTSLTTSHLKSVLVKNAPYHYNECGHLTHARGYLGQTFLFDCFAYDADIGSSTTYKEVKLLAFYQGEKLGYLKILESYFDKASNTEIKNKVLHHYINVPYTDSILKVYNTKHQSDFTWKDLYEDSLLEYEGLPELFEPLIDPAVATDEDGYQGKVRGGIQFGPPYATTLFRPLLNNHDHAAIARCARSFNPVRKAYGGDCLFILQVMGEKLSAEEKQLFWSVSHAKEIIPVRFGCVDKNEPINSLFTKQGMANFAAYYIEFISKGGHF